MAKEINVSRTSLFKKQSTATTTRRLSSNDKAVITKFYRQLAVSIAYPKKQKSAKKYGPNFILKQSGKAAFEKFETEHTDIEVVHTLFWHLEPKGVKKQSASK